MLNVAAYAAMQMETRTQEHKRQKREVAAALAMGKPAAARRSFKRQAAKGNARAVLRYTAGGTAWRGIRKRCYQCVRSFCPRAGQKPAARGGGNF